MASVDQRVPVEQVEATVAPSVRAQLLATDMCMSPAWSSYTLGMKRSVVSHVADALNRGSRFPTPGA